jgi:type II secretory ATPase GspE/PulE/Tfp pilus assembly ATPase PilB-like protein
MLGRAVGCEECDNTGYRGRIGIQEILEATPAIRQLRQLVLGREATAKIQTAALKDGMRTLKQDGIVKVVQGLTDIQQIRKVCLR